MYIVVMHGDRNIGPPLLLTISETQPPEVL